MFLVAPAEAQWTNRYPEVPGYSHHVYLEGFNLPTASAGSHDPAPSPDGRHLAFASRGWLWVLDLEDGTARRVTDGVGVDSRPAWSPDGRQLVFVRDNSSDTRIVRLDLEDGTEEIVAAEPGIELDPAFSPDGAAVVYSAATPTGIGLRRLDLEAGTSEALTAPAPGELAFSAQPHGARIVYLAKGYDLDELRVLEGDSERVVYAGGILSQSRPALSPDGRTVAMSIPRDDDWDVVLIDLEAPVQTVRLISSEAPALEPAWSPDGQHVYYAQADDRERVRMYRVPVAGGAPIEVEVASWDWGVETGTLVVQTRLGGELVPARVAAVVATEGEYHPAFAEGQTWFDGEHGVMYSYSPGEVRYQVPAGRALAMAVQGLATPPVTATVTVEPGGTGVVTLDLEKVWDAEGWVSGDQHFHLNYGGPFALDLGDLRPVLEGEGLDVGTPLVANLDTRYVDDERWGESIESRQAGAADGMPILDMGQEVRSHFFGHVGLVGTETLFFPWIWGPGYSVYSRDDRENAEVTAHARREGGIATYVHPIGDRDPFGPTVGYVPASLVADGVLGDLDGLEVVCLWTDDLGTSEMWYRLLNIGQVVVPMAGSDVMSNFHRTMAPGTARAYVRSEPDLDAYYDGLRAGRSFVTTGPFLEAEIGGAGPGGVVKAGPANWSLEVASAVPVDRVEVVVNGTVVHSDSGLEVGESRTYSGTLDLPKAGWVAFRAVGERTADWPSMASYPFAHTAPVWIGEVGSVDAASSRSAARDLLRVFNESEASFEVAYQDVEAPDLRDRYRRAREALERLAR
ncbi:CehA/McbA family metallohydrolase [Rubrivirga sp.]|uniref:CehA/McbA family metallohydrolase n=1 Tax=Rubrivirga sp. TaxID=1885344 RepID=UPI003C71B884